MMLNIDVKTMVEKLEVLQVKIKGAVFYGSYATSR